MSYVVASKRYLAMVAVLDTIEHVTRLSKPPMEQEPGDAQRDLAAIVEEYNRYKEKAGLGS